MLSDVPLGLALSHLLRRQRQHRLRAICDCFRPAWGLGLDEGAGLVLTPKKLQVSCWPLGSGLELSEPLRDGNGLEWMRLELSEPAVLSG